MNNKNYQQLLERELAEGGREKTLLLHACCAPCSSYVLTYLQDKIRIKVFYYNPNISEDEEYEKRLKELDRLVKELSREYPEAEIEIVESNKEPEKFFDAAKGLENEPEGGARCTKCFELRLRESARKAKEEGADYFTTTLTISPLKNAALLNEIGERIAAEEGIRFLPSDFKKKDGYKKSVELSAKYELYRQDYCGCVFSKRDAMKRRRNSDGGSKDME